MPEERQGPLEIEVVSPDDHAFTSLIDALRRVAPVSVQQDATSSVMGVDVSVRTLPGAAETIVEWLRRTPADTRVRISAGDIRIEVDRSSADRLPAVLSQMYRRQGPPDGPDFPTEP